MRDFLATPFMFTVFVCAWIIGFITGKVVIIAVIEEDDNEQ